MEKLVALSQALSYIEEHISEDITTQDIADACYYSESSIQKLFTAVYGYSIKEYVIKRRITRAAYDLVNDPAVNVIDIGMKYCYNSHEAFTRAFKKVWDCVPNEFRRHARFTDFMPPLKPPVEGVDGYIQSRNHVDISSLYDILRSRENSYFICCGIRAYRKILELSKKVGDAVIMETIYRLERVMDEKDMIFRIGGDEFVLLTNGDDISKVHDKYERILSFNSQHVQCEEYDIPLYLHVSIVNNGLHESDENELFTFLHEAVKECKIGNVRKDSFIPSQDKLLGEGSTAKVYDYGDGKVLKLALNKASCSGIRSEFERLRSACNCGIPMPRVYELVQVDDKFGIIMDKVNGNALATIWKSRLHMVHEGIISECEFQKLYLADVRKEARFLAKLHSADYSWDNRLKDQIRIHIEENLFLTSKERELAFQMLSELPDGNSICHGDPNAFNTLIDGDEMQMIDWVNAGICNPMYDVAEAVLLLCYEGINLSTYLSKEDATIIQRIMDQSISIFLKEYEDASGRSTNGYERWFLPLMIVRLSSNRTVEEKKVIHQKIQKLLLQGNKATIPGR